MSTRNFPVQKLGADIQTLMRGLFSRIVKSDLRILQLKIRADEYQRLQHHIDFARNHGVMVPTLVNAMYLLQGDIAPYANNVWFNGPVRSAPDILTEMINGLEEMLEGFENSKGKLNQLLNTDDLTEMNKTLVETKKALALLTKQRSNMLEVIQANRISPHQLLLLTKEFQRRLVGCQYYNVGMINVIARDFESTDNLSLLRCMTAYFIFLEYSTPYAMLKEGSLPLMGFKNDLVAIKDNNKTKAVYMKIDIDGQFHDTMNKLNEESFDRQFKRYAWLKTTHTELYIRFIEDLIRRNEKNITAYYNENPGDSAVLINAVAKRLRDKCMESLSKYMNTKLANIYRQNAETLDLLFSKEPSDEYIRKSISKSPIYLILGEMSHNGISYTNTMRSIKNSFVPMLKRAMMNKPDLQAIIMPPAMKREKRRKNAARRREQETEMALEETTAMDVDDDTATGFVATMDMEFDEVRDEFQGTRQENEVVAQIVGQYILTERSYLQYQVDFPVIQIEKMMTGNQIIGVNEAAFRNGFRPNWFIKSIEEVDSKQTDEFLKESGASAAGSQPKITIFKMFALGQKMQDRDEQEKELLEEALDNDTDMFGDGFFKDLI